ncbi:histone-fold-containing protein [Roridomyces roridus]|uniref:DNA polymerase epsilon subunit D n=1 Tax=Roridomyces roridus TaxID=1738132 RepID=A0AAD7C8A3_9AGAR|nr:histone-fold-containing protein [Roridomyces roridus]
MPRKEPPPGPISAQAQQDRVSEGMENFELPKSLVTRIAKSALPENVKMQKETVLSLIKGSTVFINYLGAAHDVALSKQHKSISASDVLKALEMIEFGDLADKLQGELTVYRELAKTDKSKKGSSNVNGSAALKGKASSAKGKEKEENDHRAPWLCCPFHKRSAC